MGRKNCGTAASPSGFTGRKSPFWWYPRDDDGGAAAAQQQRNPALEGVMGAVCRQSCMPEKASRVAPYLAHGMRGRATRS